MQYVTTSPQPLETPSQSIRRLTGRIEHRRPRPKDKAAPEFYHELIEKLDKTTAISQNYSDASEGISEAYKVSS